MKLTRPGEPRSLAAYPQCSTDSEGSVTEYDIEPWGSRGWALSAARVRLELYRLVASVLASREFGALPAGVGQPLNELSRDFEMGEIEHALVSIAITVRVLLDQESPRPLESRSECGVLTPDVACPDNQRRLTLREACNKIIHAKQRNFDVDNYSTPTGLSPSIHLYGAQFEQEWKASVDLLAFSGLIAELTEGKPPQA